MLQFQSEMVWYGIHVSELNRFGWFSKRSVVLGTCQRGPWLRWVHLYRPITSNKRYNATLLEGSNLGYKSQKLDSKNLNKRNICDIMCHKVLENTPTNWRDTSHWRGHFFSGCLEAIKLWDTKQFFAPDKTQILDNASEISPIFSEL